MDNFPDQNKAFLPSLQGPVAHQARVRSSLHNLIVFPRPWRFSIRDAAARPTSPRGSRRAKMATLSMVSVPIAPSSLPLSARGRSSSVSFPPPKVSAPSSPAAPTLASFPSRRERPPCLTFATVCLCIPCRASLRCLLFYETLT